MNLIALPALTDNYIWMLHDGRQALVVDPGVAEPVRRALNTLELDLVGILVTHHHKDHVGGIDDLRPLLRGEVYGPAHEPIPGPIVPVIDGQEVAIGPWIFRVLEVPGHTRGHVAYVGPDGAADAILFCGDTLFSGGCGRLFEGTPEQMLHSLHRLVDLAPGTRVCCAHEYTVSNLKFALAVEPGNARIHEYMAWCQGQRSCGQPTLPSTIELESQINPFLRCNVPEVSQSARARSGVALNDVGLIGELAVFTTLRKWKNEFQT